MHDNQELDVFIGKYVYGKATSTSPLTLDALEAALATIAADQHAYTRQFWQDLARENGSHVLCSVHPRALISLEQQCFLAADARPPWLTITPHCLDEQAIYFARCPCLCHQPSEAIPWPRVGKCCVCSG